MTSEQFQEVIRKYLQARVKECAESEDVRTRSTANPGLSHFSKRTGIKASSLSKFLSGTPGRRATFDWLFAVSESLGPPMSQLLQDMGAIAYKLEAELRKVENVDTRLGRAAVPTEDGDAVREALERAKPSTAKRARHALSPVRPLRAREEE